MAGLMKRARDVVAVTLVLFLAIGGLATSLATRADAAPSAIIGPTETFTGTVVEGTIVPAGLVVRFSIERPSKENPAILEQVVVESAQASLVKPGEILLLTGNYDTDLKIFKSASMVSLGNAIPLGASTSVSVDDSNSNDNDGNSNDNNDGDGNSNDNG